MNQSVHDIFNEIMTPERAKPSVTNTSSANYLCLLIELLIDSLTVRKKFKFTKNLISTMSAC